MCLKVALAVSIILTLFHQILAEPSCSKYDYEEKMLSKVLRMEIKMEELDEKSKTRDVEVTNKLDSYATQVEETKSAMLQDLTEYKANISGMIQKELDILRMDRQGAAEVMQTIEAFKKNISEAMNAVTMHEKDMAIVPAVNIQSHNPSSKLSPVSGEPYDDVNNGGGYSNTTGIFSAVGVGHYAFSQWSDLATIEEIKINFQAHNPSTLHPTSGPFIFTTVDVNNGGGYSDTTGIFTAPVTGLYAFSLQVCTSNSYIFPAIVKEDVVLLPTRHYGHNTACTSSSVYTQLSAGDKVWVKCAYCARSFEMYKHSTQAWNAFSGALVHK